VLVLADPRDAPDTRKPLRGWGKATVPVADVPGANWRPSVIVTLGPDQFGPVFGVAAERARQADLVRVVGIAGYAWTARDTGRGEGVLFYLRDDHTLIKDRKGRRVRTVYTDLAVLAAIAGSSDRAGVARLGELLLDPEKVEATGSPVSPELAADLSEGLRVAEGPRLIDEERALALALSLPGISMDASMISAARRALVSITEPTPDSEASSGLEPRRHIGLGTDLGDGRVLTAAHVVEGNVDPRVDGYPVEIVRVDEANDLALLRVRGRRGGVPVRLAETPPAPGTFTAIFDAARTDHRGRPTSWTTVFGPVDPTQGHRNMPAGALTLDQPSWPGFSGGLVVTASVDGALSIGVLTGGGQAQYGGYPSPYDGELEWWRWLTFITPATAVTSFLASRKRGPALATAGLGVALGVAPAWFGWGVPVLVAVAVAGAVAVVGSKLASWLISRSAVPGAPRAPPWLVRAARRYLTWTHSTTAGHIGALLAGVFIGAGLGVALAPALGVSHAASGSPSAVGAMGAALHGHASPGSLAMAGLFGFFPPGSNPKASLRRWAGLVRGSAASSPGRFVVVEGDGAAARGVTGRGVLLWNSVALARLADVEGDIGGMAVNGAAVEFAAADPHTGLALLVFLDRGPALAGPNGLDAADVRQWLAQLGVSPEDVARFLARHRDVIDQVVPSGTAPAAADAVPGPEAHAGTWTAPAGQALRVTAGADGGGTAFAVESGRVLTNEHVVRGVPADQIRVNGHRVTYV
ncbi:MAG: trypsin-like peptidase domain-containing protein, partial [Pseudonocardia sp.]|nr:trypsin-like peptidase domain-containing protein [Pseudonocardia sp.]